MKLRSISTFYVYSSVSLERREKNQKLENEVRELKSTITGVNIAEINMLKQKKGFHRRSVERFHVGPDLQQSEEA
jgi:hypothetical protein